MIKTIIAIDIGNTNIALGLFKGLRLVKRAKMPTREYGLYGKRLRGFAGKGAKVVISSVAPKALAKVRKALAALKYRQILVLGDNAVVPIRNLYRIKRQVGQDRLVNAYAAKILYGTPCVIIDLGTAVTFDVVSRKGAYLGGLILPGIQPTEQSIEKLTQLDVKTMYPGHMEITDRDVNRQIQMSLRFARSVL